MIVLDGYNLMHKMYRKEIPDSDLEDVREKLIKILGLYADDSGKRIRVYFDSKGATMRETQKRKENLEIIFVRNADKAIIEDVKENAPQLQVVSSDNEIIRAAEKQKCGVVLSEEFVVELQVLLGNSSRLEKDKIYGISESEVDYWADYFDLSDDIIEEI